jgi:hypothetical protein
VNVFGEVTRWRTPGHCDPEYAKTTPYGGTLMHGFHMVALLSHFYRDAKLWPEDGRNPLNYGLDKVNLPRDRSRRRRIRHHHRVGCCAVFGRCVAAGQSWNAVANASSSRGMSLPAGWKWT